MTTDTKRLELLSKINPRSLELILYPTEQCNFRCTYCYEDFEIGKMTSQVQAGVKRLIERRMESLDHLHLAWLGGEPLVARDVLLDLSAFAKRTCESAGVGLTGATLTQAERLLESVRFGADATYLTIVGDVADAYFNLAAFEGLVQANRENEDAAQSSYSVAKGKFESGIGARADELQAKAAYSQAVLNRIKSEGDVAVAKGGLTSLLGIPANSPLRLTYSAELTSVRNLEQSVDGAMTDAVNAHPAIAAARAQVEAAAANVAAVRSAGLPALSLTGSIGWQRNNASGFDSSSRSRSVGLQLTVPIFEGFARESLVRAAETDVKQRENDLAEKTLEVSTDVWSNYHSFKSQAQYLVVTQELLATALKSYNIAQGRYKAGVGSIVELLNAQTALANARQQRVKSMADYRSLAIRFAASLGRLDSSLLPSP